MAPSLAQLKAMDLYTLLGVKETASKKELKKAYRAKAVAFHPDKNPNDPEAKDKFQLLQDSWKILEDSTAKTAYDAKLKAKKAAEKRHHELDASRRKMKSDLEARERDSVTNAARKLFKPDTPAPSDSAQSTSAEEREILRLRKEGSRLVELEKERMKEELKKQMSAIPKTSAEEAAQDTGCRLKVKWRVSKRDSTNGGITEDYLKPKFSQYGPLNFVVISKKKSGSAIVEYRSRRAAEAAFAEENGKMFEILFMENRPNTAAEEPVIILPTPAEQPKSFDAQPVATTLEQYEALVFGRIDAFRKRMRAV